MCGEITHSLTQKFKEIGLPLKSLRHLADVPNGRVQYLYTVGVFSGKVREYIQDPLLGLRVFTDYSCVLLLLSWSPMALPIIIIGVEE